MFRIHLVVVGAALAVGACAADYGSDSQALNQFGEYPPLVKRCFRTIADFTHPDVFPPRPAGPLVNAYLPKDVIGYALGHPDDRDAAFLAQYVIAQLNVESGAPLNSADIDMLVAADEAVLTDDRRPYDALIIQLEAFNQERAFEVPCFEGKDDVTVAGH